MTILRAGSATRTPRGTAYLAALVVAPFAALAWGDPGPALVVVPVAVALMIGLVAGSHTPPELLVATGTDRTIEGSRVSIQLTVRGGSGSAHVLLRLPPFAEITGARGSRRVGESGLVIPLVASLGRAEVDVSITRWGTYRLGSAIGFFPGPLRMTAVEVSVEDPDLLVVFPDAETVRNLVEPMVTNLHAGDLVSSQRGAGSEVAELRTWAPSDPPRAVNWRASARSDQMWVTDRHSERNGDLVLVIDSVAEPGSDVEEAVGRVVRIVAALVRAYGRSRHRLGMVSLSGYARWVGLDSGAVHEYQLLAAAMRTQAVSEPVWMAVDRVLDRTVRRPSLVFFVSPLLDDGVAQRVRRLAAGGIDVAVLVVDPSTWVRRPREPVRVAAHRIWRMERQMAIDGIRASGVAVAEWRSDRPMDEIMEEVEQWRRRLRRARF